MLLVIQTALELGFLYAPVALALFLSFRVLDIADLTTDGCFVLGAAVSVTLTAAGHPLLAVPAAMAAGACAGSSPPSSRPGCRCLPFWRASSPIRGFTPSTSWPWAGAPTRVCWAATPFLPCCAPAGWAVTGMSWCWPQQ